MSRGELKATVVYQFVAQCLSGNKRYVILEGSTRSSKTWSIAQALLLFLYNNPNKVVVCFRKEEKNHTTTTIETVNAVLATLKQTGLKIRYSWNKQEKIFRFSNGSVLRFVGTLDPGKLHGAECDIAWLNEVMEIGYDAYKQISQRCKHQIVFDFNPSLNQHWLFSKIMTQTDKVAYRHSTFEDNPFLTDGQRAEIYQYDPSDPVNIETGTANQWHWDVYGLGRRGRVEGVIFPKWSVAESMPPDEVCLRHGGGMDFGFHPDPATLIECRLHQDTLYLKEKMYEPELLVTKNQADPSAPSIQLRLEEMGWSKERKIYADSAQPGSIQDLRISGYNMQSAIKGKDSIVFGINIVNQFRIKVDANSMNLQMELEQYCWKKGPTGEFIMGKPIDKFNHLLDPLRYWARSEAIFCRQAIEEQTSVRARLLPKKRIPSVPSQRIKY